MKLLNFFLTQTNGLASEGLYLPPGAMWSSFMSFKQLVAIL